MAHRERRVVSAVPIPDDSGPMQDGLPRRFWVRVVNYAQLDDFGTKFDRAAFDEYLSRRMPRFLYGHNWSDPTALLGKGIDHRSSKEGLDVQFELDDFEYVPAARQIAYQVKNGTLDQFSVDFIRQADRRDAQGAVWITKARLPAVSGVPEGAVPGTRVLTRAPGVRFAEPGAMVSLSDALNILSHLALGELDLPDALAQLKEVATIEEVEEEGTHVGGDSQDGKTAETPGQAAEGTAGTEGTEATGAPPPATEGSKPSTQEGKASDSTDGNGGGKEAKEEAPAAPEDAEELALADDALALIDGRF